MKKIYFAGSIRGGRDDQAIYLELINYINSLGVEVLAEHVGSKALASGGESQSSKQIHDRDLCWIDESDGVIAEVTNPSLGVGYELRYSTETNKPVLALFREKDAKRLSAMIGGNNHIKCVLYSADDNLAGAKRAIDDFIRE